MNNRRDTLKQLASLAIIPVLPEKELVLPPQTTTLVQPDPNLYYLEYYENGAFKSDELRDKVCSLLHAVHKGGCSAVKTLEFVGEVFEFKTELLLGVMQLGEGNADKTSVLNMADMVAWHLSREVKIAKDYKPTAIFIREVGYINHHTFHKFPPNPDAKGCWRVNNSKNVSWRRDFYVKYATHVWSEEGKIVDSMVEKITSVQPIPDFLH
jgi:hypothetical protein